MRAKNAASESRPVLINTSRHSSSLNTQTHGRALNMPDGVSSGGGDTSTHGTRVGQNDGLLFKAHYGTTLH